MGLVRLGLRVSPFSRRGFLLTTLGVATLAACDAPKDGIGYDIVVPIIQSNARGAATDYEADTTDRYPDSVQMWLWPDGGNLPAREPLPNLDAFDGMGIANTFVKDYAQHSLKDGRRVLVVNLARGGTGFSAPGTNDKGPKLCWDHRAPDDESNLALRAVESLEKIRIQLGSGTHRYVAFLANHGSTDGMNNLDKATFKAKLRDWISWLRQQLGAEQASYLMMQMRPDLVANELRHRLIDEGQAETAREMASARVRYVPSPNGPEYFNQDPVHFNAAGVREIGHRLYAAFNSQV